MLGSRCLVLLSAVALGGCVLDRDGKLAPPDGAGAAGPGSGGTGAANPTVGGAGGMFDPPPGPVENLAATVDASGVNITWSNPTDSDLAGVLVVHRPAQGVSFAPTDGTVYPEGEVMTGHDAIFSGPGQAAQLAPYVPGLEHHISVWAFDAAGQYSTTSSVVGLRNALGDQIAQIEITVPEGVVTITSAPPNFPLAVTATYNSGPDELDVSIAPSNNTSRAVFNLKGLPANLNQGTFDIANLLPSEGDAPYLDYGPKGLDIAEGSNATFRIDDVDGTVSPITFDVRFVDAPWIVSQLREFNATRTDRSVLLVDASGSGVEEVIDATPYAPFAVNYKSIVMSKDGRRAFLGAKSSPFVTAIDMVSLSNVMGANLAPGNVGNVSGLAMSPDGERLFAALTVGGHHKGRQGDTTRTDAALSDVALVELDPLTLTEVQRVPIIAAATTPRMSRVVAVSRDGGTAAVVVRHLWGGGINAEIFFVDLTTFTLIDTNANTPEVDPVFTNVRRPDHLLFNADDSLLYAAIGFPSAAVQVIDLANFSTTTLTPVSPRTRTNSLYLLDDALLAGCDDVADLTGGSPLVRFNLADDSQTGINFGGADVHGIVGNENRIYVLGLDTIAVFDASTNTRIDMDGDASNGVTNITLIGGNMWAKHMGAVTPF